MEQDLSEYGSRNHLRLPPCRDSVYSVVNLEFQIVFVSLVSGLEKDRNWTRLDRKKTRLQSWSLIFKNQRLQKDRSF